MSRLRDGLSNAALARTKFLKLSRTMTQPPAHTIDWPAVLEYHKPWLRKVLRSRIGDRHEVDDLFQEIALAVFRQSKTSSTENNTLKTKGTVPNDPEKVAPWLYRLAVRQAVNFHRKRGRKSDAKPNSELDPFATTLQPLDWMLAKEQQTNLQTALQKLRPQEREVLTLKYSENWSYNQMAKHLGVPVRTIEYRLLTARKKLRHLLMQMETSGVSSL